MPSDDIFVWIYLPEATEPVVAGRIELAQAQSRQIGRFIYGQSYLGRTEATPLDPVTLPLKAGATEFLTLRGLPGVIADACPDRWGLKVIDRLLGPRAFPAGYLLVNDPGRSGNLAFSLSPTEPPQELSSREFSLADLLVAAEAVEADRPVDPELLRALHPGTGGARPKCNIVDAGAVWIAKFPSLEDRHPVSIPRLEHATMRLGEACGIQTAETRLLVVDGKDVCLVRRFDREIRDRGTHRTGVLSARSVFFADPGYPSVGTGSYARLARWMPRYGCPADQAVELFRRMVFNCDVRNTDDHELNHALIHVKAIEAAVLDRWQGGFYSASFGDEELRRLEHVLQPLPGELKA